MPDAINFDTVPARISPAHEPPKLSLVALRERKKDQTREALARAAFELFRDKGYESTTVAEIARAANVSRRTFFRYYATKDALLFVDDADKLEQFRELLSTSKLPPGFGLVRQACEALADAYMREREDILARNRIIESSQLLSKQERQQDEQWEQAIAAALLGTRHGSAAAEHRCRVLASAIFGALRATLTNWKTLECRPDLGALMAEALEVFSPRSFELEPSHAATAN